MISWPRIRRGLELLVVGVALSFALLNVGAVLAPDFFLETVEAKAFLSRERAPEPLDAQRHEQLDRAEQESSRAEVNLWRLLEGISALALDAASRLLVGPRS